MKTSVIYTVGHSTHPLEYFISLLKQYNVNYLIDVRSVAASRFNPQYNKRSLDNSLSSHGVKYLHMGEEFGARQSDLSLLTEEGWVDFEKVRNTRKFINGIIALNELALNGYNLGLMCSESDPLHCHRFSMISPALVDWQVKHILKDKTVVSQADLEHTLLSLYSKKLPSRDMFSGGKTIPEQLNDAYRLCNRDIGYSPAAHKKKFPK
jgi:uncharacterized protein (DUF488 family)